MSQETSEGEFLGEEIADSEMEDADDESGDGEPEAPIRGARNGQKRKRTIFDDDDYE